MLGRRSGLHQRTNAATKERRGREREKEGEKEGVKRKEGERREDEEDRDQFVSFCWQVPFDWGRAQRVAAWRDGEEAVEQTLVVGKDGVRLCKGRGEIADINDLGLLVGGLLAFLGLLGADDGDAECGDAKKGGDEDKQELHGAVMAVL